MQPPQPAQGAGGGLPRTIIASAPASDPISQTQIVLNNLLEQVRESFLFLLEAAPPITPDGTLGDKPIDNLARWQRFRGEFDQQWRTGLRKPKPTAANSPPTGEEEKEEDKEEDKEDSRQVDEEAAPQDDQQAVNPLEAIHQDALFRSQRIVTLVQSLRHQAKNLPDSEQFSPSRGNIHESEQLRKELMYWNDAGEAVIPVLRDHYAALNKWMKKLEVESSNIVNDVLYQQPGTKGG